MQVEIEPEYLSFIYTDSIYVLDMPQSTIEDITMEVEVEAVKPVIEKKEEITKATVAIPSLPKLKLEEKSTKSVVKCMLLFDSEDNELSEAESVFCTQIMKACGLGPKEFSVVNFRDLTIHDIKERYEFTKVVLFGSEIPKLEIGKYKCTLVNATHVLYSDPLWMVQNNKELKGFLWCQLQLMFGLNK